MSANWSALTRYLHGQPGEQVELSWQELSNLVGGMPASALNHAAWWSGDRPHVRASTAAGFRVESKHPGVSVTFRRTTAVCPPVRDFATRPAPEGPVTEQTPGRADLLLVTCVKSKAPTPRAAKDLYTSPLFVKQRQYAERLGVPWFILSAEHALVAPEEWLSPYERYLPDTPPNYRQAWGAWVVERLGLLVGDLQGKAVEIHASSQYVEAVAGRLADRGAIVLTPLAGLPMGDRLHWYADHGSKAGRRVEEMPTRADIDGLLAVLTDRSAARTPAQFLASDRTAMRVPGLYSWWADDSGACDLTRGLGHQCEPGLIYAGLAGATRWPSGKRSTNTLWERIAEAATAIGAVAPSRRTEWTTRDWRKSSTAGW